MREKKPYCKPEITVFDLTVEPLNAQDCCTTAYSFQLTLVPPWIPGSEDCSQDCCPAINPSS